MGKDASNCCMAVALMLKVPLAASNTQYCLRLTATPFGLDSKPSLSSCRASDGAPTRRNARAPGCRRLFAPSPAMASTGAVAGKLPSSSAST